MAYDRILRALVLALLLQLAASVSHAQPASGPPGTDLTAEQRRAYNQGLAEARKMIAEGQLVKAAERLDALVKERPREAQGRFLQGVVQTERGSTDAAIATFRALIDDYPEIPEPYNNLAVIFAQRGEVDAARDALETAVRTAPDWAVAHENLGDVYARMAAEHYDRAATLDRANRTAATKLKLARDLLASSTRP